jgi:hypothetical protein
MQAAIEIQVQRLQLPPGPPAHVLPMHCSIGRGVVCLHCGAPIQVRITSRLVRLWCRVCLRQAPYRKEDEVNL